MSGPTKTVENAFVISTAFISCDRGFPIAAWLHQSIRYFSRKKYQNSHRQWISADTDAADTPDTPPSAGARACDARDAMSVHDARRKCRLAQPQFARLGQATLPPTADRHSRLSDCRRAMNTAGHVSNSPPASPQLPTQC